MQALVKAASGSDDDRTIFKCTFGLLFFGVPNRGLRNKSLKPIVAGQPNQWLVDNLDDLNPFLVDLHERFMSSFVLPDSKIVSFYETKYTATVEVCSYGCAEH